MNVGLLYNTSSPSIFHNKVVINMCVFEIFIYKQIKIHLYVLYIPEGLDQMRGQNIIHFIFSNLDFRFDY